MTMDELPPVSAWLQNGFHRFIRPLLRRHFHAIAVERSSWQSLHMAANESLVVYGNHPSWWDPLVSHFINRELFSPRQFFAPIDDQALQRYRVFGKLGFYGVELRSQRGAANFLKTSRRILAAPDTALWMTPEGRFADARDHEANLMPGLSHLCSQLEQGCVVPLALEYLFWDERLPVCLFKFGTPFRAADEKSTGKDDWAAMLTERLRLAQYDLAKLAIERCSDPFHNLLAGRVGGGLIYDSMRRTKAWMRGETFHPHHGEQFK